MREKALAVYWPQYDRVKGRAGSCTGAYFQENAMKRERTSDNINQTQFVFFSRTSNLSLLKYQCFNHNADTKAVK